MKGVSVNHAGVRGFDLHAPAMVSGVEDEVVAIALSPGLRYAEAEAGGLVEKGGFGDLSAALGGKMELWQGEMTDQLEFEMTDHL